MAITSPYFIPDESLLTAITTAACRGVQVELFASEKADQFMVQHAKHLTIDDHIGSSNMDLRSFALDYEISLMGSTLISLDGYHEGPGQDVLALPFDDAFSPYNLERLRAADTMVLGRTSFEGFRSYWPSVADDATQPPVEREISRRNQAIEKVVVSDSLTNELTAPWGSTTRIVSRADAVAEVAELKRGTRGDIIVFGSRTMWNALLLAGLVDELHVMIGPALLGGGTPVYGGPSRVPLRLIEARVLDNSQLVLARYDARPTAINPG